MAYEQYRTSAEYEQLQRIQIKGGSRALVCFCIDVSHSMTIILPGQDHKIDNSYRGQQEYLDKGSTVGVRPKAGYKLDTRISKLNDILREMLKRMKRNDRLEDSVVVSIITFAQEANVKESFLDVGVIDTEAYSNTTIPKRSDGTRAGEALQLVLSQIEYTETVFADSDVDLRKATIIFLSDGEPTDTDRSSADRVTVAGEDTYNDARSMAAIVKRMVADGKINFVPILLGDGNAAAMSFMKSLTPDGKYRSMNSERDYTEIFEMIESDLEEQMTMLVPDETIHRDESIEVEIADGDEVLDTNMTGTMDMDSDFLTNLFSSGFTGSGSESSSASDDPFSMF